jgi:hypothetical protein
MLPPFKKNEVKTLHDHVNGKILTRYVYKDRNCPILDLTQSKIGKTCAGLQMIIKDLDLVEATIKTAAAILLETLNKTKQQGMDLNNSNHIILWSLYSSAIITYAKCFAAAYERDVTLDVSDFNKSKSTPGRPTHKELHKKVWRLRHDWIAHSGKSDLERGKTLALLDPLNPHEREPTVLFHSRYSAIPTIDNLGDILELSLAAKIIAKGKLERGEKNLMKTELSNEKMADHIKYARESVDFGISP